jgi:hypothetical protein
LKSINNEKTIAMARNANPELNFKILTGRIIIVIPKRKIIPYLKKSSWDMYPNSMVSMGCIPGGLGTNRAGDSTMKILRQ